MTSTPFLPRAVLAALLWSAALPLAADDTPPAPAAPAFGAESQAWVQLQQSGTEASGAPRPMPGEIADNVYQRYVDSFKQPIPAEFKRQSATGSDNGSGQ